MNSPVDIQKLRSCAESAARAAGECLKQGFTQAKNIKKKEGIHNLVTQFDIASEKLIIERIREQFPDHAFLAEESGGSEHSQSYRWIIDPLDGTVNFAHGIPIFSVSIAVEYAGEMLVGIVYQPLLDELFLAVRSQGAWLNGTEIHVSNTETLDESILVTGFPYDSSLNAEHSLEHFGTLVQRGIPIRRLGSAALDLAYVACGRFDGFWESALQPWDVAAGVLLVREAGGTVTNFGGISHQLQHSTILSTNAVVHGEFLRLLNSVI